MKSYYEDDALMVFVLYSILLELSQDPMFIAGIITGLVTVGVSVLISIIANRSRLKRNIATLVEEYIHEYKPEIKEKLRARILAHGNVAKSVLKKRLERERNEYIRRDLEVMLAKLGDRKIRSKILNEVEHTVKESYSLDEISSKLNIARDLELKEICPIIFERLKQEKDSEIIKHLLIAIGDLNYVQALPFLLECVRKCEDNDLAYRYYSAIGELAVNNLNSLSKSLLNDVIDLFINGLKSDYSALIDAIIRVYLPFLLKRRKDIDEEKRKELLKALCETLSHTNTDIRGEAAERLIDLGDPAAVPCLEKRLKEEQEDSVKWRIQRALKILKTRA